MLGGGYRTGQAGAGGTAAGRVPLPGPVHSHPAAAFHSPTDDANPALSHEGAVSVVVPYFGLGLRRGLAACAVYRLSAGRWRPLPAGADRDRWVISDG